MAEPVYISATLKPAPGKTDEVQEGLLALAAAVEQNEPGCLLYDVLYNKDDEVFVVAEVYKDMAAAEEHKTTQHFQDAMKTSGEKLAAPPKIVVLQKKGGFRRQ